MAGADERPGSGHADVGAGLRARIEALELRLATCERERDRLGRELRRTRDLLDGLGETLIALDRDDRIWLTNRLWRELHPDTGELGSTFEHHLREIAQAGLVPAAEGDVEGWVRWRMARRNRGEAWLHHRHDGRWLQVREFPLPGGDRAVIAVDITEFKRNQDRLRRSEQRLRDFASVSSDWLWEMGPDLRFSWYSEEVNHVTGAPPAGSLGFTRSELGDPLDDPDQWAEHERTLEAHRAFRDFVYRRRLADGTYRYVKTSGTPIYDEAGVFAGYRGTGSDITEKVLAERALAASERRLSALLEHLPSLVAMKNLDGTILAVNRAWAQWYGITEHACVGRNVREFLQPRVAEVLTVADERVVETRASTTVEVESLNAQGKQAIFLSTRFPLFDELGEVVAIGTISTDISAQKLHQRALATRSEELESVVRERTAELERTHERLVRQERLATLGHLTGTVSHELRNPLGTIQVSIFALRRALGEDRDIPALDRIERSIARCVRIIEDLLAYSRVREIDPRPLDLDTWTRALLGDMTLPEQVDVRVQADSQAVVAADPERLRQALTNVVENACQAMTERTDRGPAPRLEVTTHAQDGRAAIRVTDNGPGIDDETLSRIFEPLFSTRSFGFGLGLPLVQRVLEQHGGEVRVDSARGEGTTFTLSLPVCAE